MKHGLSNLRDLLRGTRGKNLITFIILLGVSAVFWFVLTINDEFQREIDIPVELADFPDSVTLLSPEPLMISASVKDKGSSLIRYEWGKIPTIRLSYKDFRKSDTRLMMGESQISGVLRAYFGGSAHIVSAKPDSIVMFYTTRPGKKLPLVYNLRVNPEPGSVISGRPYLSTDSVTLYSIGSIPTDIKELQLDGSLHNGLSDTTTILAKVHVPTGMRAIPDVVRVTIPVEPLISKTRKVPVEVINVPPGQSVVTFPSQVAITYLIPMSLYNRDNSPVKIQADYNKISDLPYVTKIPLEPLKVPASYHGATAAIDSVEYVIETL